MSTVFHVSQDDIYSGVSHDSKRCPVAIALTRQTGDDWSVTGSVGYCHTKLNGEWPYEMPRVVRDFVADFDAGRSVKPFYFAL